MLGKALATGQGLRTMNLPGSPPATRFPPGYPLLLAGLWRIAPSFPANLVLFKLVNIALLAVAAALSYRFGVARLSLTRGVAFTAVLCGAGTYPALFLSGSVLSEMLFLALLVTTLWLAEALVEAPSVARAALVGVLAGLLALTRSLGLVALAVVLILLASRRQWKPALVVLLVASVFLAPWQLWVSRSRESLPSEFIGNYGSYGPWVLATFNAHGPGVLLRIAAHNLVGIGEVLEPAAGAAVPLGLRLAIAGIAAAVLVVGAVKAFGRARVMVLSLGLYLLVVAVWPFPPARFVWAVWPLLVLVWVVGAVGVTRWRPALRGERALRMAALAGSLLVVAGQAVLIVRVLEGRESWRSLPRVRAAAAAPVVRWVVTHTKPGDVVITDHGLANIVALYTGRKVLPAQDPQPDWSLAEPPLTYHTEYLARLLRRYDVCCVVVVGSPAVEAAVRLSGGPAPGLSLEERLAPAGAAFVVAGRGAAAAPDTVAGAKRRTDRQ